MNRTPLTLTLAFLLGACGAPDDPADAGDEPMDAFVAMDASEELDATADAPLDAPAADAPVPALDSGPAPVDAYYVDAREACTGEGRYRTVACCGGTRPERCTDGVWQDAGPCSSTGECEPGTFETLEDPELCWIRQRECGPTCAWTAWTNIAGPGECGRGTRAPCAWRDHEGCLCTASCMCQDDPECP